MPNPRTPRYLQLADELRTAIACGDFPDGFPTEQVLTDRFRVSRFTVREALRTLKDEGLISRRRGSGTTIEAATTRGGALHQPLSNVEELQQYANDTRFDYAFRERGPLPRDVAEAIGLPMDVEWLRYDGVRSDADGQPLAVASVHLAASLEAVLPSIRPGSGPVFRQIERAAGVSVASVSQDIQASAADGDLARHLHLAVGDPVLRIIRSYLDRDGRIFEIAVSHHPGARFAYSMHYEVGD